MIPFHKLHIRTRITLWHTLIFGSILILYAAGATLFLWLLIDRQIDSTLKEELEVIQHFLSDLPTAENLNELHGHEIDRYERLLEVWSPEGLLLLRSRPLTALSLGPPPDTLAPAGEYALQRVIGSDGTHWRMVRTTHAVKAVRYEVRLAISEEPYLEEIRAFVLVLLAGIPIALLFVMGTGVWFARRTLRPVEVMATTAGRISAEVFAERLPVVNPLDEFGHLATTLNQLLDRLQRAFDRLRRFTSDASHELRTPLTVMRTVGEVALQTRPPARALREAIGSMLEENARLTDLVERLLILSRADAGQYHLRREPVNLEDLLRSVAETLQVLADEKRQSLRVTCTVQHSPLLDRALTRQALINVIHNAIKYSPGDTPIEIEGGYSNGLCTVQVRDRGPGIPEHQRERVFDRFFRLDDHRSRSSGGAGLGLSIARWAAEAQGGTLVAGPNPGGGSLFSLSLPS